jgi:DNA invertase Pin-like site-specific DNA recombinase
MPHANRVTVGIMAMVADEERRAISRRTKEALAAKRAWYARLTEEDRAMLIAAGKAVRLGGQRGASITADATRREHLSGDRPYHHSNVESGLTTRPTFS